MSQTAPTSPHRDLRAPTASPTLLLVSGQDVVSKPLPSAGTLVVGRGSATDLRLDMPGVSRRHAELSVDGGAVTIRDLGSSHGTTVNGQRLDPGDEPHLLCASDLVELGGIVLMLRDLPGATNQSPYRTAITAADEVVARGDALLLVGEAGVGKSTLARSLANAHAERCMEIDSGAVGIAQLEELVTWDDRIVILRGLDTMRPPTQALMRSILPHLGRRTISTSRIDLESGNGAARLLDPHLRAALTVNRVIVPPLREDHVRLSELCDELIAQMPPSDHGPRVLSASARAVLFAHSWPGNARELRDVLVAASARAQGKQVVEPGMLDLGPQHREALEKARIEAGLTACAGNQTEAAKRLGISRRTLVSRLDKYGIARPRKGRTKDG